LTRLRPALLTLAALAAAVVAVNDTRSVTPQYLLPITGPFVLAAIGFAIAAVLVTRGGRGALIACASAALLGGWAAIREYAVFGPARPAALLGAVAAISCVPLLSRGGRTATLSAGLAAGALLVFLANVPYGLPIGLMWIYAASALAGPFLVFGAIPATTRWPIAARSGIATLAWLVAYAVLVVTYGLPLGNAG
jgi:hypothetical protein